MRSPRWASGFVTVETACWLAWLAGLSAMGWKPQGRCGGDLPVSGFHVWAGAFAVIGLLLPVWYRSLPPGRSPSARQTTVRTLMLLCAMAMQLLLLRALLQPFGSCATALPAPASPWSGWFHYGLLILALVVSGWSACFSRDASRSRGPAAP